MTHADRPQAEVTTDPQPTEEATTTDAAALADDQSRPELAKEAEARGLASTGTKAELAERITEDDARPERQAFFTGFYVPGVPVYGCPHCAFTYRSSGEVMWHIRENHPEIGRTDHAGE